MAVIEEEVFLTKLNGSFLYSLSNDLNEIVNTIYAKTGIRINDIKESEWTVNTMLAEETKNLMNKHTVVYSTASWVESDCLHLVINHQIGDNYYVYSGRTIHGKFLTDIEPTLIELTKEVLDSIMAKDIIYAEYAELGAMGNAGGVMIYIIKENQLNCYGTNIYKNKGIYKNVIDILVENADSFRNTNVVNQNAIFNFYGGGFGNNVFVNRNILLLPVDGYFVYINNDKSYFIYSSVQGVFDRVEYAMHNG
jgi:hypothetical protein